MAMCGLTRESGKGAGMSKNILVTGATGSIGSQLARYLVDKSDVKGRAFVRDERKAEPIQKAGAELAVGTFDDRASIRAAMKDIDTVVLIAPPGPAAVDQNSNIIKISKESSVRKVVRISAIKASADGPTENTRLHAGVVLISDFVALCQKIHSGGKHQCLEFHASVLNKPAVFEMNQ